MFKDEFTSRYKTVPLAIYRARFLRGNNAVISHQHRQIELIAMTEGAAQFHIDTHCCTAQKGDVLVIPPYAIHRAETAENTLTAYNCICFDPELLYDNALRSGLVSHTLSTQHLISGKLPSTPFLQEAIANTCNAYEHEEPGWELEAVGNLSLLFSVLKRNGCFAQSCRANPENGFAQKALDYIISNYAQPITSTTAAQSLNMNNSYFCRLFKKTFGCCFADYVLVYRLEKAKVALSTGNLSVTEIAFQTGFNNCSYFGKVFRERFGITPLQYRKHGSR